MIRILQVASVASMIDQFNMENIKLLQNMGCKVDVAANFEFGSTSSTKRVNEFKKELEDKNITIFNLLFDRKIFNRENINVYRQLKKIIDENNYQIIHCHSPIGGVVTRLAARKARKKGTKVIYTGHGFHFFKGAPFINWLIYYPVEWICAFFTDTLITMNEEDYKLAKKKMRAVEIEYINGIGIDTTKAKHVTIDKMTQKSLLGIPQDAIVLLSVGELSKRKNHQIVIKALAELKNKQIYYVICGQGELKEELQQLCRQLGVEDQVIFAGFIRNIMEMCKMADIYVFPSLQEGLPVALMEAMSAGLPCVVSRIRGNIDLIQDRKGGFLCEPYDVSAFVWAIRLLIEDKDLLNTMGQENMQEVKKFDIDYVNKQMEKIYKKNLK